MALVEDDEAKRDQATEDESGLVKLRRGVALVLLASATSGLAGT